ncbi:MAG: SufE family protein [Proteobacteria bacterium]|nr:SufE family protein [Pseudomonadota bacterium]
MSASHTQGIESLWRLRQAHKGKNSSPQLAFSVSVPIGGSDTDEQNEGDPSVEQKRERQRIESMEAESIKQACQCIKDTLTSFADAQGKLGYIVECGKHHPSLTQQEKIDRYLIKGCLSQAWLISEYREGRVYLRGDSEALIVKGLIALLMRVYNGRSVSEILSVDGMYWKSVGITALLSMNRRSGVAHMLEQIRLCALTYELLEKQRKSKVSSEQGDKTAHTCEDVRK